MQYSKGENGLARGQIPKKCINFMLYPENWPQGWPRLGYLSRGGNIAPPRSGAAEQPRRAARDHFSSALGENIAQRFHSGTAKVAQF